MRNFDLPPWVNPVLIPYKTSGPIILKLAGILNNHHPKKLFQPSKIFQDTIGT